MNHIIGIPVKTLSIAIPIDSETPTEPGKNTDASDTDAKGPNNTETPTDGDFTEQTGGSASQSAPENKGEDIKGGNHTAHSIPKTGADEPLSETAFWVCVTVPLLIALNILSDKWRKKHGKKTFAQRIKDAINNKL